MGERGSRNAFRGLHIRRATADAHIESRLKPRIHTTDTFIETMPIHTRRPRKTIARRLLHAARDLVSLPLLVILAAMTSASVGADAASATFNAALCIDTTTVGGMATTCQAFAGGDAGKQVACCAALTAWNDAGCNCAILTGKTLLDEQAYSSYKSTLAAVTAGSCSITAATADDAALCIQP